MIPLPNSNGGNKKLQETYHYQNSDARAQKKSQKKIPTL